MSARCAVREWRTALDSVSDARELAARAQCIPSRICAASKLTSIGSPNCAGRRYRSEDMRSGSGVELRPSNLSKAGVPAAAVEWSETLAVASDESA